MTWDIFGGLFDLNGDGETDLMEQALGFAVLHELSRKDDADDEDDDDDEEDEE